MSDSALIPRDATPSNARGQGLGAERAVTRRASYAGPMAGATPRLRVDGACMALGRGEVVRRCRTLLAGGSVERGFLVTLGGWHAERLIEAGVPEHQAHWLRVWGARGLLWAGVGEDIEPVRAALEDSSWRVREMACKVIARHRLGDLLDGIAELESDPVPRVRAAATRASATLIRAEA